MPAAEHNVRGPVYLLGKLAVAGILTLGLTAAYADSPEISGLLKKPGHDWKKNYLTGWEIIRLLDSGKYVARAKCDICPIETTSGDWSRIGNVIRLTPHNSAKGLRELVEIETDGCQQLAPRDAIDQNGRVSPRAAYLREGQPCQPSPSGYVRK